MQTAGLFYRGIFLWKKVVNPRRIVYNKQPNENGIGRNRTRRMDYE